MCLLSPFYLSEPTTSQYEHDFSTLWNMPNCVGAIDGKHIAIRCPPNSNSMFYNYEKYFSLVLMAVCDAIYTFTSVSVGSFRSQSDGGIFCLSSVGESVISVKVPVPLNKPLNSACKDLFPHYFVGDAAFPLRSNLMRPFPGSNLEPSEKVFNYRLSRARRVIEICM